VGTARLVDGRVHLEVKPQLVDASHPFAQIRNEENCLLIDNGHSDSQHVWTGRGAGRWPTTAAVMADLFDLSRESRATSYEPRAANKPPVSSLVDQVDGSKTTVVNRHQPELATGNWQLTTDFGGAA